MLTPDPILVTGNDEAVNLIRVPEGSFAGIRIRKQDTHLSLSLYREAELNGNQVPFMNVTAEKIRNLEEPFQTWSATNTIRIVPLHGSGKVSVIPMEVMIGGMYSQSGYYSSESLDREEL